MKVSDHRDAAGVVYLVGAGPGDPGLLTLRAAEIIGAADVVVYDRLADRSILDLAPPGAEMVYVGKQSGAHSMHQEGIHEILLDRALNMKVVVRLKGGDPFVFGRGGEEASFLAERGIPFVVVPGVTSAVAVPGCAGIPVTDRRCASSFVVVTGHEHAVGSGSRVDWAGIARGADTLVVLMGLANMAEITDRLIREGKSADTPAAIVERGTTPGERVVIGNLTDVAERAAGAGLRSPAILVVGEVVRLRDTVARRKEGSLAGKRVLVPRSGPRSVELARALGEAGAGVTAVPVCTLRIEVPPLDLLERVRAADWVAFASSRAVDVLLDHLDARGADVRELAGRRLGAMDERTRARLRELRLKVDHLPTSPTHAMPRRLLIVGGVDEIEEMVARIAGRVDKNGVPLMTLDRLTPYSYHVDERFPVPPLRNHDAVVLGDAGAVRAFAKTYLEKLEPGQLVVATDAAASAEARSLGVRVDVEATGLEAAKLVRLIANRLAR